MIEIFLRKQRRPWNSHNCSTLCFFRFIHSTLFFSGVVFLLTLWFYWVVLCFVSCVWYGILFTWNINLSFWGLLGPFELIIESYINFPTCTSPFSTWVVHIHINSLTLIHNTPCKKLLKILGPCGGCPYLLYGCVNSTKWTYQVRIFSLLLSQS